MPYGFLQNGDRLTNAISEGHEGKLNFGQAADSDGYPANNCVHGMIHG